MVPINSHFLSFKNDLKNGDFYRIFQNRQYTNIKLQVRAVKKEIYLLEDLWNQRNTLENIGWKSILDRIYTNTSTLIEMIDSEKTLSPKDSLKMLTTLQTIKQYFSSSITILNNSTILESFLHLTHGPHKLPEIKGSFPAQWIVCRNETNQLEVFVLAHGSKRKSATKILTLKILNSAFSISDRNGNIIGHAEFSSQSKSIPNKGHGSFVWEEGYKKEHDKEATNEQIAGLDIEPESVGLLNLLQSVIENEMDSMEWNPWIYCIKKIDLPKRYKLIAGHDLWFKILSPYPWKQHSLYLKAASTKISWKYGKHGKEIQEDYAGIFKKPQEELQNYNECRNVVDDFLRQRLEEYLKSEKEQIIGEPRHLDIDTNRRKAIDNSLKAISEGITNFLNSSFKDESSNLISNEDAKAILSPLHESELKQSHDSRVSISYSSTGLQGIRPSMEDATLLLEFSEKNSTLLAVFDGHCGNYAAFQAHKRYGNKFKTTLETEKGNVFNAFESINNGFQKDLLGKTESGTTAVACYIDQTGLCHTSTLGDSEAWVYRKINGNMKAIPLSILRNFYSPKDEGRALYTMKITVNEWIQSHGKPGRYFPSRHSKNFRHLDHPKRINLSRSFEGDSAKTGSHDDPGIIHKAKFGLFQLIEEDILIVACDGFWNYVPPSGVIATIEEWKKNGIEPLSQKLANAAITKYQSKDNVSVIAAKINANKNKGEIGRMKDER